MKKLHKQILVINTFGIGDVLFSTPLLRALKKHIPSVKIDFICNARTKHILTNNSNVEEIVVFEKDELRDLFKRSKTRFLKKMYGLARRIRSKKYDLAIDLSLGHQISLALAILGVKERVGFNFRNRGRFLTDKLDIQGFNDKHVIEYYLDILKLIGIDDIDDKELNLELSGETEQWAEDFLKSRGLNNRILIGLAPGGGKSWGDMAPYRRWDPENFSYVARELLKRNDDVRIIMFGSDEEVGLCTDIEPALSGRVMNLCGKLSLPQSIALIKKCAIILCNDGGILHIAVSQRVKTVSIFGPVDALVYGPYAQPSKNSNVVVTAENVSCRPCYRNFRHRICETHECLKKVDKDRVLKIMQECLGI